MAEDKYFKNYETDSNFYNGNKNDLSVSYFNTGN